jgi:hypothetical protein
MQVDRWIIESAAKCGALVTGSLKTHTAYSVTLNQGDDAAIRKCMRVGLLRWVPVAFGACALMAPAGGAMAGPHDALITKHSAAYGVPESLVRRVIHIESKGNARVVSKGNYGLMQIRLGTAKSMGYRGSADGLLDADTNMTYAVKYLASAYRAAGCNEQRAINYYQRGFYKKPTSKCALPRQAPTLIASSEAAQRSASQRSATERDTSPASGDLLQPRVVQVQTITRPKSAAVQPSAAPTQVAAAPVSAPVVAVVQPAAPAPVAAAKAPSAPSPVVVQPAALAPVAAPPAPAVPSAVVVQPAASAPVVAAPAPAAAPPPVVVQRAAAPQTVARAPERVPEQDVSSPPQNAPALPTVFMELLPMPKPRPASAPKMVAKLEATAAAASASQTDAANASPDARVNKPDQAAKPDQVAKLDSATVPLPHPKPEIEATPERESKPARRTQQRHTHTRASRKKLEEPGLVTFLKKLTTPEKPSRRRASRSSSSWLQNSN